MRRPLWRRAAVAAAPFVVVAVLAVVVALSVAVRVAATGPVLFGEVTVTGSSASGVTEVAVPPAGSMSADTHSGPLGVKVRLDAVDLERLGEMDASGGDDALVASLTDGVGAVAVSWLRTAVGVAAALGAVLGCAVAAFTRRHFRRTVALAGFGALCASVAVAAAGFAAHRSFDPAAFESPRYDGALRYAPAVLDAAGGASEGIGSVASATETIASRIEVLAGAAQGVPTEGEPDAGDVVLLHVSDLHLNPLGAQLAVNLTAQFSPDAVIDTGDFTSFGVTDLEAVYSKLVDIDVPYYLAPGNHDSASAVEALRDDSDIEVLDGNVVSVRGLRITGVADPTFTPAGGTVDRPARADAYARQHPEIEALVKAANPDVVALHNPVQATAVQGHPVTVLSGHTHKFWYEHAEGTQLAVVGSTGADGLGAFTSETDSVYAAQLLRFRRDASGRFALWSLDRIEIDESAMLSTGPGRFRVERIALDAAGRSRYLADVAAVPVDGPVKTTDADAVPASPASDPTLSDTSPPPLLAPDGGPLEQPPPATQNLPAG